MLATTDAPVGHKLVAADAAWPLREHALMLASSAARTGGPFLVSDPGSFLASAEGTPIRKQFKAGKLPPAAFKSRIAEFAKEPEALSRPARPKPARITRAEFLQEHKSGVALEDERLFPLACFLAPRDRLARQGNRLILRMERGFEMTA